MLNYFFDLSILYDLLIAIIILIVLIIFIKSSTFRLIVSIVLGVLFILISAFCGFEINNYYSASGGVYGVISSVVKPNNVLVNNLKFSFDNLVLTSTGNENEYNLVIEDKNALKLTDNTNYLIFVNGSPTNYIKGSVDFITCEYKYVFYDENFGEKFSDILTIKFSFFNNSTKVIVTTNGGSTAVDYWNSYFNNNLFEIEIKEFNGNNDKPLNIDDEYDLISKNLSCIKFVVDDEEIKHFDIINGSSINTQIYSPNKTGYTFLGWSIDGVNIVDYSSIIINENTTFYALFEIQKFVVSFYDLDGKTLLGTRIVDYGTIISNDDNEFRSDGAYRWTSNDEDAIETFQGFVISGDVSLRLYQFGIIN